MPLSAGAFSPSSPVYGARVGGDPRETILRALVAGWRLNESGSGPRGDHVLGHTLADVNNNASSVIGVGGRQATFFAGVSTYLQAAHAPELCAGSAGLTVAGWARKDDNAIDGVIDKYRPSTVSREWRIQTQTGTQKIQALVTHDGATTTQILTANNAYAIGVPFFFALRYWPWALRIGLDIDNQGTLFATVPAPIFFGTSPINVGALESPAIGSYLTGMEQLINIWQRPLTDQELAWLRNNGAPRRFPWQS